MNRALLVYIVFFMGMVFMATPRGVQFDPFLLSDRVIHVEDWFYYLWEHIIKIVLFYIVWKESTEYLKFFQFMYWFQWVDLIDYVLLYNEVWFYVGIVPISANTVGFVTAGIVLFHDHIWKLWK